MKKVTISEVQGLAGFIERGVIKGERATILQKAQVAASDLKFYMFLNQLDNLFLRPANIDGDSITHFFVLFHNDGTADIYTDYSLVHIQIKLIRTMTKGESVHVSDIDDVRRYKIEGIKDADFRPEDAVICAMKVGWKYGLFFDFTRRTNAEEVWLQLGQLYNSLRIDRIIENIQNSIKEEEKPHFITEGKTDWKHLEAARRILAPELTLGYPVSEDTLGDDGLLRMCEQLSKFGPRNKNKVIAIFDRDNPIVLKELAKHGDVKSYQVWGNNVYSLAIPVPKHREKYQNVCIELLYLDKDLARKDKNGKRLFFDNEIKRETIAGNTVRWLTCPPDTSREYEKKVFSKLANQIEDSNDKKVGLSKAAFARYILDQADDFRGVQFDGFIPLFNLIKDAIIFDSVNSNKNN